MDVRKQKYVAPRRHFPASAYVILTAVQERSLGCARDDNVAKRYQNSAALHYFSRRTTISHFAFLISNFSCKRGFQMQSRGGTPYGPRLNLEPCPPL